LPACNRAPEGTIEALKPLKYHYPGNWKLQMENYSDNYHPQFLHQSALEIGRRMIKDKYDPSAIKLKNSEGRLTERAYARGHGMADYNGSRGGSWMNAYANPDYRDFLQRKFPGERAQDMLELDLHMMIYPNLLLHTRMNHYRVVKPLAVDRTEVWAYPCRLRGAPEDVNDTLVLNTSHHVSAMGEVQVDDMQAFTWVQSGLQVEDMEWVLFKLHGADEHVNRHGEIEGYGPSEEIIRHQYREWQRLMAGA
jgi:benzoate/toluate 1,2-dioxygenase subunit alpha